jgi:hypothetical protein
MMPAWASSFSRFDSSVGDMRGTPRLRSLKRRLPHMNSRSTRAVQRVQTTSRSHRDRAKLAVAGR